MDRESALPGVMWANAATEPVPVVDEIWLLGQPALGDYLEFMRTLAVGNHDSPQMLCDEWRRANDHYYELEQSEAGVADQVECRDLDPALTPLVDKLLETQHVNRSFNLLPITFGMVELDRLVVYQQRVTGTFVDDLKATLGPAPDAEALFRFCLPAGQTNATVKTRRLESRRYAFSSDSTDLRFQEPVLLGPGQLNDYTGFGPIGAMLGLAVGFGSNLLSVIRADDRLLLQNGYHRACTLRALGVTHAPCIIQSVTRRDELAVIAPQKVVDSPAFYFKSARPPLLKDFFDPRLRKVVPIRRTRKVIELTFELRELEVAE